MKKYLFILCFIFGIFSCKDLVSQSSERLPNTYGMNQNIHSIPSDIEEQQELIDRYLSMGYGGFTVNVSYRDYLTETGMQAFKSFCDKALEKDMELWLYDEQGYPSGNAGGRVILKNEKWEAMGIFKRDTMVNEGLLDFVMPPGRVIKAVAINRMDTLNLQQYVHQGRLIWTVPRGEWKILAFSKNHLYENFQASRNPNAPKEKLSSHYPSLMIPEVTQVFLKSTHEKYADYLGADLGKYFVSTFTDEPSLMAMPFSNDDWSVIPWAEILSDSIKQRFGYFPEDKLVELFEDEGPLGQEIRFQYFHTVGELISVNYFRQIKNWGRLHNLRSGGHLLLEETMMAHVPLYGDLFACFREMDVPGIDALSCIPENTPVHAPKLASSAAELSGSSRIMCEPCPVVDRQKMAGREPDTEQVRGFINIQLAGGVTDFNNYLNLSNANGEEKNAFNQYVAAIAQHLRGGHCVTDIAIHYPIESLWTHFIPEPMKVAGWDSVAGGNKKAIAIEQSFRNTCRILYHDRRDYNIVDTKAIEDSKVIDGQLVHGKLKWKLIILPNVNTLSLAAYEKLYHFVASGGFLIAVGHTPVNSTTSFPDQQIMAISEKLFQLNNAMKIDEVEVIRSENLIDRWLGKDILVNDPDLPFRVTHRKINNDHVYFVFNDSNEFAESAISLRDLKKAFIYFPNGGDVLKVENTFSLRLKPWHGVIIRGDEL